MNVDDVCVGASEDERVERASPLYLLGTFGNLATSQTRSKL